MKFNIIFFLFFITSCVYNGENLNKKISHNSKGFAIVYNEDDFISKNIDKKFDNFSLEVGHKFLKKGTLLRITNPENDKKVEVLVKKTTSYPELYSVLITKIVAYKLDLDNEFPYVEIEEILKKKSFVAKKAVTFNEEKKIFANAPVDKVLIDNIGLKSEKKKKLKKFDIIIAEFYSLNSAQTMKSRILQKIFDFNHKKIQINRKNKTNYVLYAGPYLTINLLKDDYVKLKKFGIENLDIKIYE